MGMFNIIKSKRGCPTCGGKVGWQSKNLTYDGFLVENLLQEVVLNKHIDGEVHAYCERCKKFVEITIKKGKEINLRPRNYWTN